MMPAINVGMASRSLPPAKRGKLREYRHAVGNNQWARQRPRSNAHDQWSGHENIVGFERLIDLREPFRPRSRAAATFFIEGQFELAQQFHHFAARGDMREAWPRSERRLVEIVKPGETAREELAIDHALGQTIDRAEAETERQLVQPFGHQLLVA